MVFATTIVLGIGIFTLTFLFWCIFGFCVHIHLEIAPHIKLFEKVINKNQFGNFYMVRANKEVWMSFPSFDVITYSSLFIMSFIFTIPKLLRLSNILSSWYPRCWLLLLGCRILYQYSLLFRVFFLIFLTDQITMLTKKRRYWYRTR